MQNSLNVFFLYVIFVDFFLSLNYRHEINQRGRGLRRREGRRTAGGKGQGGLRTPVELLHEKIK